jgi:MYXO-CTERM domain-containing protein
MTDAIKPVARRGQTMKKLVARGAFALSLVAGASASFAAGLKERPMTAPAAQVSKARAVNSRWIELYLPEKEYNAVTVKELARYTITSPDDASFAGGIKPIVVQNRHWPESAPYADYKVSDTGEIRVAYRVFLKVPAANTLKIGKNYALAVDGGVGAGIGGQYTFNYSSTAPNESIHVNQVAYASTGPKIAYMSGWTGEGTISFEGATTFKIINVSTGATAFQGNVNLDVDAATEVWSKSNVYSMDFSAFTTEGTYRVFVPNVGASYPFKISSKAFNDIGYTVVRGLTMQRDGNHGLNSSLVTQWFRPASHLDDAVVESNGLKVNLVGGHMDAGDRGKYFHNVADVSASLLAAAILFPNQIVALGESLQLPESANGIPDYLDETIYELDLLYKSVWNTPKDGTLPFYLRPQNPDGKGGYELGIPLEGKTNRKFYDVTMGPNRSETLYAAGALALAYNTPLLQQYAPAKCQQYLAAAKKAFNGFTAHNSDASYFTDQGWYDVWTTGPQSWADEMLVAAVNLHEATGDAKYIPWITGSMPANLNTTKRWGWQLSGPWLIAFLSIHKATKPGLEQALPGIHAKALQAIINWGDATMMNGAVPYAAPFGAPLMSQAKTNVGWYFSGEQVAFPAMMAYGVTGDVKYKNTLIKTWSWLLGTNPLSRTFYTGMGDPQRSPRWIAHEIGHFQYMKHKSGVAGGWSEIPPGLPAADIQSGDYDAYMDSAWNMARKSKKYPAQASYAPLYRYHDSWTVKNEFTIDRMSRSAASLAPLFTTPAPAALVAGEEPIAGALGTSEETAEPAATEVSANAQEEAEAVNALDGEEEVATGEQALGVDPSASHADPGAEDALALASCSHSQGGSGSIPGLLGALGLSALLVRSRRRGSPS